MSSREDGSPEPYQILGEIISAQRVVIAGYNARRVRAMILLLSGCVAIMMTGFGIIYPVFARRLGELGDGVQVLGWMTVSFALAQLLFAPLMGSLADRYGRRPVILLALFAFALTNLGFLFASSASAFIALRALEGALTAGLFPAAMGFVGDTVPENQRARWVGVVMGSYATGFFIGPILGGFLYDGWGYAAPFVFSAILGALAFILALILVPETRTPEVRKRERLERLWRAGKEMQGGHSSFWESLPRPLHIFATLLLIDFMMIFTFAFVEPQMVFYFYDDLGWTTIQFGLVVGAYGLMAVIGQGFLGPLSDRYGRKPLILAGVFLNAIFYAGLALITSFPIMLLGALAAGLGEALIYPALSAFYLDITAEQHRSRIMGLKESAAALGGVLGPLLIVGLSGLVFPQVVFLIALILMVVTVLIAGVSLRAPDRTKPSPERAPRGFTLSQVMAAQTTLRSVVIQAQEARKTGA